MNKRVLVVDDDRDIRMLLRSVLEDEAYDVDIASDGLAAWEKLSGHYESYAMILLDLTMPRMNGLQLIERLKQQEYGWTDKIIVLSGDTFAIERAIEMGIQRSMRKPFDLERLLAFIADLLLEDSFLYG